LHTNNSGNQRGYNISLNGKGTPKATTYGNLLIKSTPLNLSSTTNPQLAISQQQSSIINPQLIISQQ